MGRQWCLERSCFFCAAVHGARLQGYCAGGSRTSWRYVYIIYYILLYVYYMLVNKIIYIYNIIIYMRESFGSSGPGSPLDDDSDGRWA